MTPLLPSSPAQPGTAPAAEVVPALPAAPAQLSDPSLRESAALADELGCDPQQGLSAAEAARRLAANGPNALPAAAVVPAWRRWLAPLAEPLVLLLLAAALVALGAWWLAGAEGWPMDALVIVGVVVLNTALGLVQEAQAARAVAALARMAAPHAQVWRGGQAHTVPSTGLVVGDVLLLAEGDAVPADARLLQASGLRLLEAALTGESEPVAKETAPLPGAVALAERNNMVFQGTAVAQGNGRALVTATGARTELGAVAQLLAETPQPPSPLQTEVAQLSRVLGGAALAMAVLVVAGVWALSVARSGPLAPAALMQVLLLGVSLAVAAVPEGLPAILSVVLALGVRRMAARRAIVKQLAAVETLGSASVIATDKTGTLTRAEMTLVQLMTASGRTDVSGVGYEPTGQLLVNGAPLPPGPQREEAAAVLVAGSLAGNAGLALGTSGAWEIHGDPTEAAFLVAERKLLAPGELAQRQHRFSRVAELPFSSDRKMMSTLEQDHAQDGQVFLFTKGAPEMLLRHCTLARIGAADVLLDEAQRQRIRAEVAAMSDGALRTLSVACRTLGAEESQASAVSAAQAGGGTALENGLTYLGTAGLLDPPRPEAAQAVAQARRAGIRVVMITGDHPRTALRVATDLGLVEAGASVLTGPELDELDAAALAAAVRGTCVFARVAPRHKLRIVHALQAGGAVVAMTGDGVNDAPALQAADIGIAMGLTGTEVSQEAARMILADDNFATLVDAVREGRAVLDNIRKFLRYLLSSNLGEVLTVCLGVLLADLMGLTQAGPAAAGGVGAALVLPLLATQILWINLLTDAGPALAMGVDPVTEDLMARPPRPPSARLIDTRLWLAALETGAVMATLSLATLDAFLPGGLLPPLLAELNSGWAGAVGNGVVNGVGEGLAAGLGVGATEGPEALARARTAAFTVLVLAQLFNALNARSATASAWHGLWGNRWLWATLGLSLALQVAVVHTPWLQQAFSTVPLSLPQWAACAAMAAGVLVWVEVRKALWRAVGRAAER